MESNLNKLSEDWIGIKSIILFGTGFFAQLSIPLLKKSGLDIHYVIDNNTQKQGTKWMGIQVVSYEQIQEEIHNNKIVVLTSRPVYFEIAEFLMKKGLKENIDFCVIGQFTSEWFWKAKKMNCIYHVDMAITSRCTFKCKHCNMFIPLYKEAKDYSFEELKYSIDLLLQRIDYLVFFCLLGGEPFLNGDVLRQLVIYIGDNYREKLGNFYIHTNGGIVPSDEMFQLMQKYRVHVTISDYSRTIPYSLKLQQWREKLKDYGIENNIKESMIWTDFGFPEKPCKRSEKEIEYHRNQCNPEWNGLNDNKFYYCNVAWSAGKSGLYQLSEKDYVDLEKIDINDLEACNQIAELSRGTSSFCEICGGCGSDNKNFVKVGEQIV